MTTTRTLPAQAQITSPSGWTATVTYRTTFPTSHLWQGEITGPDGWRMPYPVWSANDGEPDPMAALSRFGRYMEHRFGLPYLPERARMELAPAIAGMYGDTGAGYPLDEPCPGCHADAGEPCRPDCLSYATDSNGQPNEEN